jgi:hypothetical protein
MLRYVNREPTTFGWYWQRCPDTRVREKIVRVRAGDLSRWKLGRRAIHLHSCSKCEWAGPLMPPGGKGMKFKDWMTVGDLIDRLGKMDRRMKVGLDMSDPTGGEEVIGIPSVVKMTKDMIGMQLVRIMRIRGVETSLPMAVFSIRKPKAKEERIWIRMGDASEYESFDGVEEAGCALMESGVNPKKVHAVEKGMVAPGFAGRNYISLFWGDAKAQFIRELTPEEFEEMCVNIRKDQA